MKLNIKKRDKIIIENFISINGEEFKLHNLLFCLTLLQQTTENDKTGYNSIRNDEVLQYIEDMFKFIRLGLATSYLGPDTNLFICATNKKALKTIEESLSLLDWTRAEDCEMPKVQGKEALLINLGDEEER